MDQEREAAREIETLREEIDLLRRKQAVSASKLVFFGIKSTCKEIKQFTQGYKPWVSSIVLKKKME